MTEPSKPTLYALIDALAASPPRDHETVERVLETSLTPVSEDAYQARDVTFGDVTIDLIDYRLPPGDDAGFGPLLALTISGSCIAQSDIMIRYGLDTVRSPSGHSTSELTYWSRHQPWGELSFGFSAPTSDSCLRNVVFDIDPSDRESAV